MQLASIYTTAAFMYGCGPRFDGAAVWWGRGWASWSSREAGNQAAVKQMPWVTLPSILFKMLTHIYAPSVPLTTAVLLFECCMIFWAKKLHINVISIAPSSLTIGPYSRVQILQIFRGEQKPLTKTSKLCWTVQIFISPLHFDAGQSNIYIPPACPRWTV